jgi:superkiller protein 3
MVHNKVEIDVKARRTRLGAGTEKDVRKAVEGEVLSGDLGMGMVEMLREVGGHPGVDESIRRDVEVREFGFWRKLVGCLGCVKVLSVESC